MLGWPADQTAHLPLVKYNWGARAPEKASTALTPEGDCNGKEDSSLY